LATWPRYQSQSLDRPSAAEETVLVDPSRPDGASDIYLIFDGRRIAKRGKPGTLHAMTCAGALISSVFVVMSSHKPAVVIY
jgi:hypothetical protein